MTHLVLTGKTIPAPTGGSTGGGQPADLTSLMWGAGSQVGLKVWGAGSGGVTRNRDDLCEGHSSQSKRPDQPLTNPQTALHPVPTFTSGGSGLSLPSHGLSGLNWLVQCDFFVYLGFTPRVCPPNRRAAVTEELTWVMWLKRPTAEESKAIAGGGGSRGQGKGPARSWGGWV